MKFKALQDAPRLLIQAKLRPVQGSRFQPTGFPDLGAAEYRLHDETPMLLVESAQSMANRLEAVCWDEGSADWVEQLDGLPYVRSTLPDGNTTSSVTEAHRLNSPYIVNSEGFQAIREDIGFVKDAPFDRRKLAAALVKYDPCSLLHGVFLEKVGGVVRLPRALAAFIEAEQVRVAPSGGVKFDRVQPETTTTTPYGKADEGFGNVPYHREEYTASAITAYFNLDLALLRGLGLHPSVQELFVGLSLFKIQRFLQHGLRLRTACDLDLDGELEVQRIKGFAIPSLSALEGELPKLIKAAAKFFAAPAVTEVSFDAKKKKSKKAS